MARRCTVCEHPKVEEINTQLAIESNSNRKIAAQYQLSMASIRRHRMRHLPKEIMKAQRAQESLNADAIWRQLQTVNTTTLDILREARDRGDHDLALRAIARAERQIELIMKLLGELDTSPQVNLTIVNSQQWINVRTALLAALQPYPDARVAAARALQQVGDGEHAAY